jgi:8-oxo-dGTP pyrophosphatase MutT (NUDIX family)
VIAAQAERLRKVLLDPAEAFTVDPGGSAQAAVLVPLHEREGELCAVFTQRPRDLPRHAGQISFPGGRVEHTDPDLIGTALREAHEEIGLPPSAVEVLGALRPIHVAASDFAVYPLVGAIGRPTAWVAAAGEVEAIHELTLAELAASAGRAVIVAPDGERETPTFMAGGLVIWGATAVIVADLLARLGL